MFTRTPVRLRLLTLLIMALALVAGAAVPALAAAPAPPSPYFSVQTLTLADGTQLERMMIAGPPHPPAGSELQRAARASDAAVALPVPAYSWVFGCSSVSASMIAAYWDRNGLPNMYTGPTNGGVMPMDNSVWPRWTDVNGAGYPGNPLTASRNGQDGRATRGSIDDYWVYYNSSVTTYPDPYITGGWQQHAWGDAVGDYMWTSQSAAGNTDGSTLFWGYGDATRLTCATLEAGNYHDGTLGRKHFYEARGYTVATGECYNQKTDNQVAGGFSFAQYKAKIDAGYPVFLNLAGHSIVGVGYDTTTSPPTVILNDTWDWSTGLHTMPWGGSYSQMALQSVSIVDPVRSPSMPTVSIGDVSQNEGNSGTTNFNFTVSLSAPASSAVTVNWATTNGTATSGSDYATGGGTLTFAAGQTSQTITVQVTGDTLVEPNETFYVNLSNASGANIADGQGVGTIVNDDTGPSITINDVSVMEGNSGTTPANFTVTLSQASAGTVTVNWTTADGTAAAGTDYASSSGTLTFPPGSTTQPVAVLVNGDTAAESNETFYVNLSGASGATIADGTGLGTIVNDDQAPPAPSVSINDVTQNEGNSGTTNLVFTVSLSGPAASAVTVNWATANGTATAGSDYTAGSGTLNFAAGQTSQIVTVAVIGDVAVEPNETFNVNLSSPSGATIADGQGIGTITNDDTAPPTPSISINDVSQNEGRNGKTAFVFTVSLSAPASGTVSVSWATANGTATAGSDYVAAGGTLSFTPGQISRTLTVQVNGDKTRESNETFYVNLSSPAGATIADNQGTGTIGNDDQ